MTQTLGFIRMFFTICGLSNLEPSTRSANTRPSTVEAWQGAVPRESRPSVARTMGNLAPR